jgi:murein DD-endopeptidase MepM/ murein hydrolase activator NlpD
MLRNSNTWLRKKRTLLTLGALLIVNVGVAQLVIAQIKPNDAEDQQKVLGTETVAQEEGQVVTGNADTPLQADARPEITIYTVKNGDTISGIAEKFHISVNTIRWANDLTKTANIKVGQKLVILPITGVQYTVKNGDTISGIASKFEADQGEILDFNDLEDPKDIKPGMKIIIPDAEMPGTTVSQTKAAAATKSTTTTTTPKASSSSSTKTTVTAKSDDDNDDKKPVSSSRGGMVNPVPGSILTQGLHDVNAVDFGAPTGTPVRAVKGGTVIVAKNNGAYNGGFGNFIVIDHGGSQTLYAHLSKVEVSVGDSVDQGEQIGKVGSTGKSTGPHLHLEVHGGKNPWTVDKKGTHY